MQTDPVRYWQELNENYRQMSDGELLELAADIGNLTEVAQQVLRDELKKRGLDRLEAQAEEPVISGRPAVVHWASGSYRYARGSQEEDEETEGAPREYTWKTLLCECESQEQAWQVGEALRRAGIESWIEGAGARRSDLVYPRVNVAADQLEQARAIAAQPIPQDIIEASRPDPSEVAEFVPPNCPKCGAEDPVLESVEPVNSWLCEACGAQWSDPEESASGTGDRDKSSSSR